MDTFAVQLAHWKGGHVITTSSAANLDFLRSLGADETIDYTETRFEDVLSNIDVVLDAVGGDVIERSWRVLRPGGILISVAKPIPENAPREHGVRGLFFIVAPDRDQSEEMAKLVAKTFPLAQARDAFELAGKGHTRGKIVLTVQAEGVQ